MAIKVTCGECQARLQIKEELSGHRVKCPKCKAAIDVPNLSSTSGAPTGEGARLTTQEVPQPQQETCPSCSTVLPPNSVLCVNCGFHLLQKKHLSTRTASQQDDISDEEALRLVKAATCPQCGGVLVQPEGFCPICTGESSTARSERQLAKLRAKREEKKREAVSLPDDAYERSLAERREASHPYVDYRQATVERLAGMWRDLDALAEDNQPALQKMLERWPRELRQCKTPNELFELPKLHAENLRTFELLTHGAQRLAEVIAADLALSIDPDRQSEFRQRQHSRIVMLGRLAKRLGRHHRGWNVLRVDLDDSAIDSLAIQGGADMLGEELSKEISKRHFSVGGLAASAEAGLGSQRLITLQILKWEEAFGGMRLYSITRIQYVDEEPGPGDEKEFERTTRFNCSSSRFPSRVGTFEREMKRAWVEHVFGQIPAAILDAGDPAWAGIDITCPCCGHPDVVTEKTIPKFERCLRCGNDAITGQSEEAVAKGTAAQKKVAVTGYAVAISALPVIGFWIYYAVTRNFSMIGAAITHLVGVVGIIFSVRAFLRARGEHLGVMAEHRATGTEFKYPDAVAKNQQMIRAMGKHPIGEH